MPVPPFACRIATLSIAILLAVPRGATAQAPACWPIVPGDTASGLARRLTGDDRAAYSERFQVRLPSHRAFLPKSRYEHLNTGWQVCVAPEILVRPMAPATAARQTPPALPAPPVISARNLEAPLTAPLVATVENRPPPARTYDVERAVFLGLGVSLLLLASTVLVNLMPSPPAPPDLQRAGEAFVLAFARPLIDPGAPAQALVARFRFVRRSAQLEIYLAPGSGRTYPNLRDHKRNVEYDVRRVLGLLGPRVAVGNAVRAEGKWVVVPIRLVAWKEAGAA